MTPIVFWASLEPWLKATKAALARWSQRLVEVTCAGTKLRKSQVRPKISR